MIMSAMIVLIFGHTFVVLKANFAAYHNFILAFPYNNIMPIPDPRTPHAPSAHI